MDSEIIMENTKKKIHDCMIYRDGKIALTIEKNDGIYTKLTETSRHIELLTSDLREALICCHNEMKALGYCPQELPMPDTPDIDVQVYEKNVRIVVNGMLPFPLKGGAYFLHKKLDATLMRFSSKNALPRPLFNERCAVVFIHHYATTEKAVRNIRDYDNVERRCITNVLARYFLKDDSPKYYISMDILAPGNSNFTEIRLMTIPCFREFIMSAEIEYTP